jgi:DNA polymerase elongation subunit (family B)
MSLFYTNVQTVGNNILYRGVNDGKRTKLKIPYQPTLYEKSNKVTNFTSLDGIYLQSHKFDSMREARDYLRQFEGVSGKTIYGQNRFEYAFIGEQHKEMIDWDFDKVSIAIVDIEVGSENGFPDPYLANEPVTAIALRYINGHTFVFGCGDYEVKGQERYMKCKDEYHLLKFFLKLWQEKCPDVLTGWNTKFFDVPYLVNRMRKVLGEDETKKLSPWGLISERQAFVMNRKMTVYELVGVGDLDYLELYKWYSPNGKSQESYRLDAIAQFELGEGKISYEEYDNLNQLYRLNYQLFIEYNIKDVDLILKLEDKLKLIELALTLAYDTKTNYDDVFAQTRMWDALTYNNLMNKNIVVPPRIIKDKSEAFEGAYVKDPQVGLHEFVASFDLNSLYPHLMMQYNISPETLIEPADYTQEMRDILSQGVSIDKLLKRQVDISSLENATLTPNGQFFRTDIQGFLPKMMEDMYEDRKKFKKMMIQAKKDYEAETDDSKKYEIEKRIARFNNLQLAKKVSLNSAYGALGSQYFRFYDLRMALGVTTAGQLSIKWIENKINSYMNKLLSTEDKDYVIASDTDSIYLKLGPLVNKVYGTDGVVSMPKTKVIDFMDRVCKDKIEPYINESYNELAEYIHAYAQKMQMKREALADKGIWTAKKRYIMNVYDNEGVRYTEPDMKVMGLEMIKSSTPAPVREKMKQALQIIMKGTEPDMHKFIDTFRTEFKKLNVEDISFPRGINGLKEYGNKTTIYSKGTPIHVRGALLYNKYLEEKGLSKKYPLIQEGEKIKFTYLKTPNTFKENVVSFPGRLPPEFGLQEYIDYNMQFNKTFLEPIKVILDCMNWTTERTNSLFD